MLVVVLALAAIFGYQNALAQVGMGPLNINLIQSSKCEGDQGLISLDIVSVGDKKGFNVDYNAADIAFDETISYEARLDKIQNGQIQEGVFRNGGSYACEDLEKFLGKFWKDLVSALGLPDGCPKAPATGHVDNYPFNEKDLGVDKFLYGRFLLNVNVKKSGSTIACLVIEFTNSRPGESV